VHVECRAAACAAPRWYFDMPTVTGTENLMMAAALAKGRTTLVNAAREPEVEELARVLNKMGARIEGAGTDVIVIEGVESLHPVDHAIMPDRIEAGTYMVAAAATGGDVLVEGASLEDLEALAAKMRSARASTSSARARACAWWPTGRCARPTSPRRRTPASPPTCRRSSWCSCAARRGAAHHRDHLREPLHARAGAQPHGRRHRRARPHATVDGVPPLSGAEVMATDLRASASWSSRASSPRATTEVRRVYHLDRGYEHIERKLAPSWARIERVQGDS
jgi:UDP-N-acetylglucosamine 1-carboxyvinyltransferase